MSFVYGLRSSRSARHEQHTQHTSQCVGAQQADTWRGKTRSATEGLALSWILFKDFQLLLDETAVP